MKRILAVCCVVMGMSALAQEAMDMSKMGPWTRPATNEKQTKKEILDFFKKEDELMAKGDMDAMFARIDFPVFMATDDSKGNPEARPYSREEYVAMMKPYFENAPKDTKTTHKPNVTVLSDSLAVVVDEFSMTHGKTKMSGKNMSLLAKVGGQWKFKTMVEAGWGDMEAPKDSAPKAAAAPAAAPAPAPKK